MIQLVAVDGRSGGPLHNIRTRRHLDLLTPDAGNRLREVLGRYPPYDIKRHAEAACMTTSRMAAIFLHGTSG
jgi:hypothetical protein